MTDTGTALAATLTTGDILYSSWGWDQTNVDFYIVRRATDKTAWIEQVASNLETSDGGRSMTGRVVPNIDAPSGEVTRHRIRIWDGAPSLRLTSYSCAYPWDGQPKHCSWYG